MDTMKGILANTGGPKQGRRSIILTAAEAVVRYVEAIWAPSLARSHWRPIESVERPMDVSAIYGYRTISVAAA